MHAELSATARTELLAEYFEVLAEARESDGPEQADALVRVGPAGPTLLKREADEGVGRGPGVPPHIRTYSANLEHETPDQPLQLNFPDDIPSPCALLTGTGRNKLPADCP